MRFSEDYEKQDELAKLEAIYDNWLTHTRSQAPKDGREKISYLLRMRAVGLLTDNEVDFYKKENKLEEPVERPYPGAIDPHKI